ncbi:MAG TPA: hypothetical protein VM778_02420 [Gemmatimonadota bacterium]|nr:hypothetical protein [Gemmatimonadota bacterium]
MAKSGDKEFERLAVLHAMGALSPEESARFEATRAERGVGGEQLVQGVERALARRGGRAALAGERADLAAVTATYPRRRPWPWVVSAMLLSLALAGALAWGLAQRERAGDRAAERDAAFRRADSLAAAGAASETRAAALPRPENLAPLLASAGLVEAPLEGVADAEGRLLAGPAGALLVAHRLPPLGQGVYRLWRMGGAGPEPVAVLGDAPLGFLFAVFPDPATFDAGGRLAITAERDPDAALPAGPTLLEGTLSGR